MTFDVFFQGTRYPIRNVDCPTWRDVVVRVLAILRSNVSPDDYEVREENGTVKDAAAATPADTIVSFFMRRKGTTG